MLEMHILNVGKGSCAIIDFPSKHLSMIDIDNSRNSDVSLTDPIEYIKSKFNNRELFRFVLTHPDMDHMSGLDELTENIFIRNFWDTKHNKTFNENDWKTSPYDQDDWDRYLELRECSENPKCLRLCRGETSDCCWVQDNIKILSPSDDLVNFSSDCSEDDSQKYNHLSYVLMIEHAGVKVLLGGDASIEAWKDILDTCNPESLKADIFIAPHHGSKNNIYEDAFEAIAPDYVIVSVAEGIDYDYDYYNKLAKNNVLSTKYHGTIKISINDDGTYLPILVQRGG